MRFTFIVLSFVLLFTSCKKNGTGNCLTKLDITATNIKPTVGDNITLTASTGESQYTWSGPNNFHAQNYDNVLSIAGIAINQSGWYYCGASGSSSCYGVRDSIYIDVQYKQGSPPCSLTSNSLSGTGIPTLQGASATKQFSISYNSVILYASGTYGYPTYTFVFNSYNGNTEPKDGIYVTTYVQAFDPFQDANVMFVQCQYSSYYFASQANQTIYVSHVNGKLQVAFCGVTFSGDDGGGYNFDASFSGKVIEK